MGFKLCQEFVVGWCVLEIVDCVQSVVENQSPMWSAVAEICPARKWLISPLLGLVLNSYPAEFSSWSKQELLALVESKNFSHCGAGDKHDSELHSREVCGSLLEKLDYICLHTVWTARKLRHQLGWFYKSRNLGPVRKRDLPGFTKLLLTLTSTWIFPVADRLLPAALVSGSFLW